MSFGKIYEQTFTGSMMGAGPNVFSVWSYVIAHLRPPGLVELNPRLLAAVIGGITVEQVREAIGVLTSPDPESRSKEHDGRRLIQEGEFLYRAPNFERYRNGTETEQKAANAARQKAWRERQKKPTGKVRYDPKGRPRIEKEPPNGSNGEH